MPQICQQLAGKLLQADNQQNKFGQQVVDQLEKQRRNIYDKQR